MKNDRALAGGLLGAIAMSVVLSILRLAGVPVSFELLLGSALGAVPSLSTWFVGFAIHLLFGCLFGVIYGWLFERVLHRARVTGGLVLGSMHAIVGGLFLGVLPLFHARIPELDAAPGPFWTAAGPIGPIALLGVHLLFGAIVGAIYGGTVPESRPGERAEVPSLA